MKKSREAAITELKTELTMRQKVWKKLPGSRNNRDIQFYDRDHQRRYDILLQLLDVLEDLTDMEYNKFTERVERRKAMEEQPVLDLFAPTAPDMHYPLPGNDY